MNKENIRTPWGKVVQMIKYDKDLSFYQSTNGSGYQLSETYNRLISYNSRIEGGWYGSSEDVAMIEYLFFLLIKGKGKYGKTRAEIKTNIVADFNFKHYERSINEKLNYIASAIQYDEENSYHAKEFWQIDDNKNKLALFRNRYFKDTIDEWEFEQFFLTI